MINKAILIGRLSADVEARYTQSGTAVSNFTVVTNETWTKDGKKEEKAEFHRVVAFARLGEICGEYLTKGSLVYLEGKIQTRKWEDNDGNNRYTTEIVAREMRMIGGKTERKEESQEEPKVEVDNSDLPF